jgi:alkylmercury lyase
VLRVSAHGAQPTDHRSEEIAMTDRTTDLAGGLADRLVRTEDSGLDAGLLVPLLRLLVEGHPLAVEDLADAAGRSEDDVRAGLALVPDTEYDEQDRIVGQGLTLRPTVHRFAVDGNDLYTWCALDTLAFPALLARPARIESTSPTSGQTVRVTVDPAAGVTRVEPATAVVSLIDPERFASIRSSFCNQVHYFASPEDAEEWLAEHPDGQVVTVAEAHWLGSALASAFLDGPERATGGRNVHPCC